MAFPMTHMHIAYRLISSLPWIQDVSTYMVGSIAPDSVHFRDDYSGEIKSISHLFKYGPSWGVTVDNEGWKKEILDFWNSNREKENLDFLTGYVVHILTDWMNDVYVWQPFRDNYQTVTYEKTVFDKGRTEQAFNQDFNQFRKDLFVMNQWLYAHDDRSEELLSLLNNGKRLEYIGLINMADLDKAIDSLLFEQFGHSSDYDDKECQFYTRKVMNDFIDRCVSEIPELLM